jgi:hypothetical protein
MKRSLLSAILIVAAVGTDATTPFCAVPLSVAPKTSSIGCVPANAERSWCVGTVGSASPPGPADPEAGAVRQCQPALPMAPATVGAWITEC